MTTTQRVDFTSRDFAAIRADLVQNAAVMTDGKWTDHNPTDIGTVLLDLFAGQMDMLNFMQERYAWETYAMTARLRQSMIHIAHLLNYTIPTIQPSKVGVVFSLPSTEATDSVLSAGTRVQTSAATPIIFETLEEDTIPAGFLVSGNTIPSRNQVGQTQTFVGTGMAGQAVRLEKRGACLFNYDNAEIAGSPFSISVSDSSDTWTYQSHLLDSILTDKHFTILFDDRDYVTLLFGDGIYGARPAVGEPFTITYPTGGGVGGNVPALAITDLAEAVAATPAGTGNLSVGVSNALAATGGQDAEDIDVTRHKAPATVTTNSRSISYDDFQINVEVVPGASRVKILTVNDEPSVVQENTVYVLVVPNPAEGVITYSDVNSAMKASIMEQLTGTRSALVTTDVIVAPPTPLAVAVEVNVYARRFSNVSALATAIEDAITNLFDPTALDAAGRYVLDWELGHFAYTRIYDVIWDVNDDFIGRPITDVQMVSPVANLSATSFQIFTLSGTPTVNITES